MKNLKRTRYYTMNSWNLSTAPAYNLKVYNVISNELQDKVYELMNCENFYDEINLLKNDFDAEHNYKWQAGFNGRSGGYLVLYRGGKYESGRVYLYPAKHIEDSEVPVKVKKAFRQLAINIVKSIERMAKESTVITHEYQTTQSVQLITSPMV